MNGSVGIGAANQSCAHGHRGSLACGDMQSLELTGGKLEVAIEMDVLGSGERSRACKPLEIARTSCRHGPQASPKVESRTA